MADITQDAAAPQEKVVYASPVTVKRSKRSYGKAGILALTQDSLVFLGPDAATTWTVPLSSLARLRKPWYGMGSYLTLTLDGAYCALAFGRRGPNTAASAGNLAMRYGGVAGIGAAVVGDALAVSQLHQAAAVGGEWYRQLRNVVAR